jgi:hypothetical protein
MAPVGLSRFQNLLPVLLVAGSVCLAGFAQTAAPFSETWHFDNLHKISTYRTRVEGKPKLIETPEGSAVQFDGVKDAIFVADHPLSEAETFTWEAIFQPAPLGPPEQRFFHLQESDAKTGEDTGNRMLFEIRVVEGRWALDSFIISSAGEMTLLDTTRLHPLGAWYAVAMTYDGRTLRHYVDGVEEGAETVPWTPPRTGYSSVGTRANRVSYFKGAIRLARMTKRVLAPAEFLKASDK